MQRELHDSPKYNSPAESMAHCLSSISTSAFEPEDGGDRQHASKCYPDERQRSHSGKAGCARIVMLLEIEHQRRCFLCLHTPPAASIIARNITQEEVKLNFLHL